MISYWGFRLFQGLLSMLPIRMVYLISSGLAWVLQKLVGYRKSTISNNLSKAFPELKGKDLKKMIKATYLNLADTSLESLIGTNFSSEELRTRMKFINPEVIPSDRHALLVGGHQGNWEWGGLAVSLWFSQPVVGVYKPMKQKRMDAYFKARRKKWGLRLLSMRQTFKYLKEENSPSLLVLIADQSPGNGKTSIWTDFFNRPAAFNVGPEKIACDQNWPIYFYSVKRTTRGHYEVYFELLSENPTQTAKGEITVRFKNALEKSISKQPEDWLWSHKRWKKELPKNIRQY